MTKVKWTSIPDQIRRYARYESHGYAYVSPEGIEKWNALADAHAACSALMEDYRNGLISDEEFKRGYLKFLVACGQNPYKRKRRKT